MATKKIASNLKISKLKSTAMKLRANHQIPYVLWCLIRNLDVDSNVAYINSLKADSEHYMRVNGYYKKYPSLEAVANNNLRIKYKLD